MAQQRVAVLSCTNRPNALSRQLSDIYASLLAEHGAEAHVVDLQALPSDFAGADLYDQKKINADYQAIVEQLTKADKWVWIVGEYNGSFPGVLKSFIDGLPYPWPFRPKVVGLVGLSSGVQGGGLALSHLTDILHYLGVQVLAAKPKLSRIEENLSENTLKNALYKDLLTQQALSLVEF